MDLLSAVLGIVVIDLVLSGDNAVVIGMAAHRLPERQRRMAILLGGGAAIVLRMTLTAIATMLLTLPLLKAIGGALLLWIAVSLLKSEGEDDGAVKQAATLRGALLTILVADAVMSLDNVLGVAAAAHGDLLLLVFGLAVSMAVLMLGGSLVASLINRLWWLAYVGAAVIAWTGVDLLLDDAVLSQYVDLAEEVEMAVAAVVTVLVVAAAHMLHRRTASTHGHA